MLDPSRFFLLVGLLLTPFYATSLLAKPGYKLIEVSEDAQPLQKYNSVLVEKEYCKHHCCKSLFKDSCSYPGCKFWTNDWTSYVISPNKVIECTKTKKKFHCYDGRHDSSHDGSTITYRLTEAMADEVAILDIDYVHRDQGVDSCRACTFEGNVIFLEDKITCRVCGWVQIREDFESECPTAFTKPPTRTPIQSPRATPATPTKAPQAVPPAPSPTTPMPTVKKAPQAAPSVSTQMPTVKNTPCPISNDFPCPTVPI